MKLLLALLLTELVAKPADAAVDNRLHGTWEGTLSDSNGVEIGEMLLTFHSDDTFDFEMLPTEGAVVESLFGTDLELGDEASDTDDLPEELVEEFTRFEKLADLERIALHGIYETKDDSLLVHSDMGAQYAIADNEELSGLEYVSQIFMFLFRFIIALFTGCAAMAAEAVVVDEGSEDLTEEELFYQFFVPAFSEALTPEQEQEIRASLDAELEANPLWPFLSLTGRYSIAGQTLSITYTLGSEASFDKITTDELSANEELAGIVNEEGPEGEPGPITIEFKRRGSISTSIAQTTWGKIKRDH